MDDWRQTIWELEKITDRITRIPVPDETIPDLAGRIRRVEVDLGDYRRALLSEVSEPMEGDNYRIEVGRKADRTYNTARLLAAFSEAWGTDLAGTVRRLVTSQVVSLRWSWSRLEKELAVAQIGLSKAYQEIDDDDLDGPMVGEVWKTDTRLVGKTN